MLQNPSKYHANPLSHFLALHNTQASHGHSGTSSGGGASASGDGGGSGGVIQPHALPTAALAAAAAAAAVTVAGQSSYQIDQHHQQQQHHHPLATHHHHHQQQQPQQHPPTHGHIHAQGSSNHPQQQQQPQSQQQQQATTATSHAHLIEAAAAHTSLSDVGKSFTIAAILGLQQSAIECQRHEYNNAINLSINGGASAAAAAAAAADVIDNDNNNSKFYNNSNYCSSTSTTTSSTITISNSNSSNNNNNSGSQNVNNFNCDSSSTVVNSTSSSLVNRYLPSHAHHPHPRSSFAAAAAVAAAATAATPSALQSLQQLHQHHAQQASLSFQREKLKSESHKKSALKSKRVRTIFTPEQLERLEAEFERQQYMVGPERLYLAHTLQLTEAQVKVWFQNRRIKWRKHHLELTQQRLALIRQSQLPNATSSTTTAIVAPGVIVEQPNVHITAATTMSLSPSLEEENEDSKHSLPMQQLSRAASESDLSICNDSLDGDSLMDGSEEA